MITLQTATLVLLLAPVGPVQDRELRPDTTITVELRAIDEGLEKQGPSRSFLATADSSGTLYVWASSAELDPFLRVEQEDGELVAEDGDSGGGTTALVIVPVEAETKLHIHVAAAEFDSRGAVELHLVSAPETAETLDAIEAARLLVAEAEQLRSRGERQAAAGRLVGAMQLLESVPGTELSAKGGQLLWEIAGAFSDLGAMEAAIAIWERARVFRERCLPPDHLDVQKARMNIGFTCSRLGDFERAREYERAGLEVLSRTRSADDPLLQQARRNLSYTVYMLGEYEEARALRTEILEVDLRSLPEGDLQVLLSRQTLATSLKMLGRIEEARALYEQNLEAALANLPTDAPFRLDARLDLAGVLTILTEWEEARALIEEALEIGSRSGYPEDGSKMLWARLSLAATLSKTGARQRADELGAELLAVCERTRAEGDSLLQTARHNYASLLTELGRLEEARRLLEMEIAGYSGRRPDHESSFLNARNGLAVVLIELGDLHGGRQLLEETLEICTRALSPDHPRCQQTRETLGAVLYRLGNLQGARELCEEVVEINARTRAEDHDRCLLSQMNLAVVLKETGHLESARDLLLRVVDLYAGKHSEDHELVLQAKLNLANVFRALHELPRARALAEEVLSLYTRAYGDDHNSVHAARMILADILWLSGERRAALDLQLETLETLSVRLPHTHSSIHVGLRDSIGMLAAVGERVEAREHASRLAVSLCDAASEWATGLSPGELGAQGSSTYDELSAVLFMALQSDSRGSGDGLLGEALACSESLRGLGLRGAAFARAARTDPEIAALCEQARRANDELVRLTQQGVARDEFAAARRARETAQRAIAQRVASTEDIRTLLTLPDLEHLSGTLGPQDALVGYRQLVWWGGDAEDVPDEVGTHFCAFVVRAGGELDWVKLGPAVPITSAVQEWRDLILTGLDRPAIPGDPQSNLARIAGERLRALAFDPLRPALGGATRIVFVPDDVLHAVPLDALPDGDGLLGGTFQIELRSTFWELLLTPQPVESKGGLLALGGIDYDLDASFEDGAEAPVAKSLAASTVEHQGSAFRSVIRGGAWRRSFQPLAATASEVRSIADLYERGFPEAPEVQVIEGDQASRSTLLGLGSDARFLHLATHGWFAPESVVSSSDVVRGSTGFGFARPMSIEEQVIGTSPMLLCGLALAGANLPPDRCGRVPGVITAEEVATLDLSDCELAVLSACDTNVGVRRAGQGVASLQQALHMAGARSAITSLWKVSDEATKELMIDFYRRLWVEEKPKRQALWEAKQRLREQEDSEGRALYRQRDWAGWVLTGDPE